jgi:hypothetical protein
MFFLPRIFRPNLKLLQFGTLRDTS